MTNVDLSKDRAPQPASSIWYQKWRPGVDTSQLIGIAQAGARAFIIEAYHSGTLPTAKMVPPRFNALTFLQYTQREKIPVFMTFGESVTDPDLKFGYQPFDDGVPRAYESTRPAIALGLVPLRASTPEAVLVIASLEEILTQTTDSESIENRMYDLFPFRTPLAQLRSAILNV